MNELKSQGCEVIFYILNQVPDDIYHASKHELPITRTFRSPYVNDHKYIQQPAVYDTATNGGRG